MRLNESVAVITNKIVFVPYEASHVLTYSEWMSSEALREATASERLSLPEEYAMQASWREDTDKLTFILSLPSPDIKALENASDEARKTYKVVEGVDDNSSNLIGDVNLFLYEDDEDEEDTTGMVGEIELMIARDDFQGKGFGKIAVLVFILYVIHHQKEILMQDEARYKNGRNTLKYLRVKIGKDNVRSLGLFEKLGFEKTTEAPNYFGEWEMRFRIQPLEEVTRVVEGVLKDSGLDWREEVEYIRK